jgi:phosphoribosyl 1,2-cyclic phosphodiesterase
MICFCIFVSSMSLYIASIASGSNGNCYYVGNAREAVLIDAGISCREIVRRMERLGLDMKKVKAIFISHEHSDHIRGLEVTAKKFDLPVYITPATLQHGGLKISSEVLSFESYQPVCFGDLRITAFPKQHDAADPYSFVVEHEGIRIGVFTDIGTSCDHVINNFRQCHAVFLEANYDEKMLEEGGYPFYLKRRIRGDKGHLSNDQALALFKQHRAPYLSHLLLSHLSKNNNSPALVEELFKREAGATHVAVASRYQETGVFQIHASPLAGPVAAKPVAAQLTLF